MFFFGVSHKKPWDEAEVTWSENTDNFSYDFSKIDFFHWMGIILFFHIHGQIPRWGRASAGREKDPATEAECGSDLKLQRRQEMWNQKGEGGGEQWVVPQSLWPGLQAAPHGQESSASGSRKDFSINGNMGRVPEAPGAVSGAQKSITALFLHGEEPASHPCCSRSRPGRECNAVLDYTAKEKLLWCLVTEFKHSQSVIIVQNHAWFVLWGVSPSGFFWPVHWKLSWKQLIYIGHQLLI